MADARNEAAAVPTRPWKRYVWIAAPLVLAVLAAGWIYHDEIRIRGWINRLSSAEPRIRREQMDAIRGHPDVELVNRLLADAVGDDSRTFEVRTMCANLLLERQRLPTLEGIFRGGSLQARGVVLKAFSHESWFATFVEEQGGRVQETVRQWVARADDPTRAQGIQLAVRLELSDVLPSILPVLDQPATGPLHPSARKELLIAAAGAVERFGHCASVPTLARMARDDADSIVRLRTMQIVERMVFRENPPARCPDALEPEVLKRLVHAALDDEDSAVRMGSMLLLARRGPWAAEVSPRLQEILDGRAKPAERRQALDALAAAAQPAFLERLPRYFHDPSFEVRSSATRLAPGVPGVPLTGCLVGLVQDEAESEVVFTEALESLMRTAGVWIGLPEKYGFKASMERPAFRQDLHTLFVRGEIVDATRQGMADAWFRWWCDRLGLSEEDRERAFQARVAFHAARARGDAAAAEAALDGYGTDVPGLFTYERAWLQTR